MRDNLKLDAFTEDELVDLHSKGSDFPLPDLDNLLYCIKVAVRNANGKVVAIGLVKLTAEAILVLDHDMSRISCVKAILKLKDFINDELFNYGMDECQISADNSDTAAFMERIGFVKCEGIPMVKELSNGQERT